MVENNKLRKTILTAAPLEQELFCIVFVQRLIQQGHVLRWLSNTTTMQMK